MERERKGERERERERERGAVVKLLRKDMNVNVHETIQHYS